MPPRPGLMVPERAQHARRLPLWAIRVDLGIFEFVWLRGNLGSTGCPVLPVEGVGLASQTQRQSISDFPNSSLTPNPNHFYIRRRPAPLRGALRNVTDVGRDAVDAAARLTGDAGSGRRSRVVLTPRRWRQVGGSDSSGEGGNKARSPGRARRKPLKPLRGECRVFRRDRGD
jgi:hypothetical protein